MSNDRNPQRDPNEEQRRYYDRYLADEMRASGADPSKDKGSGSSSRMPLLVGGGIAAALLVGGGIFLAVHDSGGSDKHAGGSSSSVSATSGGPSSGGSGSTGVQSSTAPASSSTSASAAPVISGWKSVVGNSDYPVVYDVPQDWKINRPTIRAGFSADFDDQEAMMGYVTSNSKAGYCKKSKTASRAFVVVIDAGQRDPGEAGPEMLGDAVDIVARSKDGKDKAHSSDHGSRTIKLHDGTEAVDSSATTDVGKGKIDECNPKQEDLRTVAFTNAAGHTYCFFIERDVASDSPAPADLNKIVSSIRALT